MRHQVPTKSHKKPHTIRGSHRVYGEVPVVEEKDFPVAFKVKKYHTVCPSAKTPSDLLKDLPTKSGYMPIHVRAYKGKFYRPYQYRFGAINTLCGVKSVEALRYKADHMFRKYNIEMTPPESGKFLADAIMLEEDIYSLASAQQADIKRMQEFCSKFVSFKGKLWTECGEPFYHYMVFGMGNGNGSTGFFVDFENEWLAWHRGEMVYNAFHREQCLDAARKCATMRNDSMTLLNKPKEDIEIFLPKLVKIKENIF
jgi:hypothetical protein